MNNIRSIENLTEVELQHNIFGGISGGSWHEKYKDSAWVYLGGLPFELTEGDIICVLSQFGEIEDIHLIREKDTNKSKGFAFVKYEDHRSTILAVDNFNGTKLLGRVLRCDHVDQYRLPKEVTERETAQWEEQGGQGGIDIGPGHAYKGKELANEFDIANGVNLWAKSTNNTTSNSQKTKKPPAVAAETTSTSTVAAVKEEDIEEVREVRRSRFQPRVEERDNNSDNNGHISAVKAEAHEDAGGVEKQESRKRARSYDKYDSKKDNISDDDNSRRHRLKKDDYKDRHRSRSRSRSDYDEDDKSDKDSRNHDKRRKRDKKDKKDKKKKHKKHHHHRRHHSRDSRSRSNSSDRSSYRSDKDDDHKHRKYDDHRDDDNSRNNNHNSNRSSRYRNDGDERKRRGRSRSRSDSRHRSSNHRNDPKTTSTDNKNKDNHNSKNHYKDDDKDDHDDDDDDSSMDSSRRIRRHLATQRQLESARQPQREMEKAMLAAAVTAMEVLGPTMSNNTASNSNSNNSSSRNTSNSGNNGGGTIILAGGGPVSNWRGRRDPEIRNRLAAVEKKMSSFHSSSNGNIGNGSSSNNRGEMSGIAGSHRIR